MPKIIILGAGRVGSAIAKDLSLQYEITAVDKEQSALNRLNKVHSIKTQRSDLATIDFSELVSGSELVISAVPGFLGYNTLKKIIEAKKNVVDISFFSEDPFTLDELARKNKVKAIIDCGVAPGMGNIILSRYNRIMEVARFECLVGGLPEVREWPWQYKAVFSPIDVLEEYIRPARFVSNGKIITKEALSDPAIINFDEIGELESFNTDGLRTLIKTMKIPDMIEKTLRYPGTIEYLRVLRSAGFFSRDHIEVSGNKIRPLDFTSKLLFPIWKLNKGEKDLTVMRIIIQGKLDGIDQTIKYQLIDRYDEKKNILSMARTTGYTCSSVAHLLLQKKIKKYGIIPPEYIGEDKNNFDFILDYLAKRNVKYQKSIV